MKLQLLSITKVASPSQQAGKPLALGATFSAVAINVAWSGMGTPSSSAFWRRLFSSSSLNVLGRRFAFCNTHGKSKMKRIRSVE